MKVFKLTFAHACLHKHPSYSSHLPYAKITVDGKQHKVDFNSVMQLLDAVLGVEYETVPHYLFLGKTTSNRAMVRASVPVYRKNYGYGYDCAWVDISGLTVTFDGSRTHLKQAYVVGQRTPKGYTPKLSYSIYQLSEYPLIFETLDEQAIDLFSLLDITVSNINRLWERACNKKNHQQFLPLIYQRALDLNAGLERFSTSLQKALINYPGVDKLIQYTNVEGLNTLWQKVKDYQDGKPEQCLPIIYQRARNLNAGLQLFSKPLQQALMTHPGVDKLIHDNADLRAFLAVNSNNVHYKLAKEQLMKKGETTRFLKKFVTDAASLSTYLTLLPNLSDKKTQRVIKHLIGLGLTLKDLTQIEMTRLLALMAAAKPEQLNLLIQSQQDVQSIYHCNLDKAVMARVLTCLENKKLPLFDDSMTKSMATNLVQQPYEAWQVHLRTTKLKVLFINHLSASDLNQNQAALLNQLIQENISAITRYIVKADFEHVCSSALKLFCVPNLKADYLEQVFNKHSDRLLASFANEKALLTMATLPSFDSCVFDYTTQKKKIGFFKNDSNAATRLLNHIILSQNYQSKDPHEKIFFLSQWYAAYQTEEVKNALKEISLSLDDIYSFNIPLAKQLMVPIRQANKERLYAVVFEMIMGNEAYRYDRAKVNAIKAVLLAYKSDDVSASPFPWCSQQFTIYLQSRTIDVSKSDAFYQNIKTFCDNHGISSEAKCRIVTLFETITNESTAAQLQVLTNKPGRPRPSDGLVSLGIYAGERTTSVEPTSDAQTSEGYASDDSTSVDSTSLIITRAGRVGC